MSLITDRLRAIAEYRYFKPSLESEAADRIDKLEEFLREFCRVIEQVTPENRERVFQPSIMAAYDKSRALLEEK